MTRNQKWNSNSENQIDQFQPIFTLFDVIKVQKFEVWNSKKNPEFLVTIFGFWWHSWDKGDILFTIGICFWGCHQLATVILVTLRCGWLRVGGNFWMLVTKIEPWLPSANVDQNDQARHQHLRLHQHRCSLRHQLVSSSTLVRSPRMSLISKVMLKIR